MGVGSNLKLVTPESVRIRECSPSVQECEAAGRNLNARGRASRRHSRGLSGRDGVVAAEPGVWLPARVTILGPNGFAQHTDRKINGSDDSKGADFIRIKL